MFYEHGVRGGGGNSPDGRSTIGSGFRPIGVASGEDSTPELLSVASRCYTGKFAGGVAGMG